MDEIVTARHIAERDGANTSKEWRRRMARHLGMPVSEAPGGKAVSARINAGRWIADCECGGAEYVDPDEPVFLCLSCGNRDNGGHLRPVKFPKDRQEIEARLLARPVRMRAGLALPIDLPRDWRPGVTAKTLAAQNRAAGLEG